MKWAAKTIKKIIFGHVGACIILLCIAPVLFIGHRLYRGFEIKIEQMPIESEDEDLIVVGFSQLGSESGWRTAHTTSIQQALTKDAGYFLIFNNARQMQDNQIKAIRSFISQRVDYIVFAPVIEGRLEYCAAGSERCGDSSDCHRSHGQCAGRFTLYDMDRNGR